MSQLASVRAPGQSRSSFDPDAYPSRRTPIILLSVLAGFALTVIWSAKVVDRIIGGNVADTLLGHNATSTPITGVLPGVVFAFVTGIAGTFTACNIAAMGVIAPLVGDQSNRRPRFTEVLKPIGWISAGIVAVSATYGVIVALVGTKMPQFSTAQTTGLSPRNIQSMVTFGLIGLAFIYLGLASLGVLPNVLAGLTRRYPATPMIAMGVLIGGFLIGRPFGLFRIMFRNTAETHNVVYGAAAFTLQSLGNIVVMALLFIVLVYGIGGRLADWLTAKPGRIHLVTGAALIMVGTFTLLYWDVRVLGRLGYLWYPIVGW